MVNPAGVFQVLREQNGMSTPIRATLWIHVVGNHLLSEQVLNEHGVSHSGHDAAQTHRTSKQVAVAASTLAEEALTAPAALVDRVSHQRFAALECSCAQWSNRRWGFDDGADNCVAGKRACSTARVSRAVVAPHIRQPPGPSRQPSRMGMSLDGVMARCSSGSSSALSTTNCESGWIVLGETPIADVLNALRPLVHQCGAQPRVQHRCRW